jgi:hypothetical protein
MKYSDIKEYTRTANYAIDVPLDSLQVSIARFVNDYCCDLDPDFQRPHVWTETQARLYVEHILKGGSSGKDILFNCPEWHLGSRDNFVLVDGKQRLEAFRLFFADQLYVFGHLASEFEGRPRIYTSLKFHVNDLKTRTEVLQWYLDFNTGGTVHTPQEIARVRGLLEAELQMRKHRQ